MTFQSEEDRTFGLLFRRESRDRIESERQLRQERGKRNEQTKRHWRDVLGPAYDAMLLDREATEHHLYHPDPPARRAALYLLMHHWPRDQQTAVACERMAFEDRDCDVRKAALLGLGECYSHTDDSRVGALLARCVRDESELCEVREAAYFGLFDVRGRRIFFYHNPFEFRFPQDVDWSFVDSFLSGSAEGSHENVIDCALLSQLAPKDRSNVVAVYNAKSAFQEGRYMEALVRLTEALETRPTPLCYYIRGCARGNLGNLDEAIADFTAAIDMDPGHALSYFERSESYRRKGLIDLAEADHRRALELDPSLAHEAT